MDTKPSALVSILAGGAAGAAETICTYPAEFVKTRRQLPTKPTAANPLLQRETHTALNVLRDTIRTSGLRGLYSGCSALAVSNAAKGGIRFISFTQTQAMFDKLVPSQKNSGLTTGMAGLTAGIVESAVVVTPGEAIKTKIIHDRSAAGVARLGMRGLNLPQAVVRIVQTDGLRTLWSGLVPVMCKQGTNSAVRFASYGWIQEKLATSWGFTGVGATLAAGAASGVVTTYASMPFDNIKTIMQSTSGSRPAKPVGMLSLAVDLMKTEGPTAFWRATTPRLVRLTMSSAITFTVFNQIVVLTALGAR